MMKINSRAFMNMTKGHYYKILQHGLIEREKPVKYPNYMLFPLLAFFDFVKLLALALTNLDRNLVNLAKPSLGQPSY